MTRAIECIGPNELRLAEYPTPVPTDDAVLLKIRLAGVCGTDLEGIRGHRTLRFPVIPGHEIVAEVDRLGSNWQRNIRLLGGDSLRVGDRVTISPRIVCGNCFYCRNLSSRQEMCINARTYGSSIGSGEPPHILGGWAEHIYMYPGSDIIKLPEGLSDDLAVLCEPLAVAVGLVDRFRREHDWIAGDGFGFHRTVVIYGAGTIGILAAAAFAAAGAKQIVMIDISDERLLLSKSFGVSHTVNPASGDAPAQVVKEITDGLGADVVVEACGVPRVIGEGIRLLRRGGRLYEIGHLANVGMAEIDPHFVCRNEISICGYYAYSSESLVFAAEFLARRDFPCERLIHKIPLSEYNLVFDENLRKKTVKLAFDV